MANEKTMALVPVNISEAEHLATLLCKSQLVPESFRNRQAETFMAIAYGLEIGIPPVSSLRAVAVIKGKPTLYADAMVGLVLASGKAKYFTCIESDGVKATYETLRVGSPSPVRKTFTLDDARQAKLTGNDTYTKYPRAMLEARAKSALARDCYPDMLHGIYSAEEVSEFRDEAPVVPIRGNNGAWPPGVAEQAEQVLDAEIVGEGEVETPLLDRVRHARSLDELGKLTPQLKKAPAEDMPALRDAWREAQNRLAGVKTNGGAA
jgi:hypothetical protein